MELYMDENKADVITDTGKMQNALAKILPPGVSFYVGAKKPVGSGYFSFEDTVVSNLSLHHKISSSTSSGSCLTYSSSGNTLVSAGSDCEAKLLPLCIRETGTSDLTFVNNQCGNCDDVEV